VNKGQRIEKIGFIINPNSGSNNSNSTIKMIKKFFNKEYYEPIIALTKRPGHASEIAKDFLNQNVAKIVAVGGDGTVNEIGKVLINTETALGIIPIGSGNGLARHLKIPLKTVDAINVIKKGKFSSIDYGKINGIPFFCTCGIGFDALVGKKFAKSRNRGFLNYFKSTVLEFFKYKPRNYEVIFDNTKIKQRAFLITFANASQYGNNVYISPLADIKDGLLNVCLILPFPFYRVFNLAYRLFNKTIDKSKYFVTFRVKKITVLRERKEAVHFDGEPLKLGRKIKIKVIAKGLDVIVP